MGSYGVGVMVVMGSYGVVMGNWVGIQVIVKDIFNTRVSLIHLLPIFRAKKKLKWLAKPW
jgi:hypothetical protein